MTVGSVSVRTFCWVRGMCPDLGLVELGIALGGCFAVHPVGVAVDAWDR